MAMKRDLIVLGGSAGSLEVLLGLAAALPGDLAATLLVVVHTPARARSMLPQVVQRRSALQVRHARDGEPLLPGHILVAPPDHHLLVEGDRVRLTRGPRENGTRPAIDPLFRTAARWAGRRAVGVVLSGSLDDGTAGMLALRARGGACVVQSPDEATHPGMPRSVLGQMTPDHVVTAAGLAPLLLALTGEELDDLPAFHAPIEESAPELEPDDAAPEIDATRQDRPGSPSAFSCPDCHGVLWEVPDGPLVRFRCRVGHAFSPESLAAVQEESVEDALWVAYRALEESAAMSTRLTARLRERGLPELSERYEVKRAEALRRAHLIRRVLSTLGDEGASVP